MSPISDCECLTCGYVWEVRVIAGHKASPWDRFAEPDEYEPADCPRCGDPESSEDKEEWE